MLSRWRDYFTAWFRRRREPPRDQGAATLSPLDEAKLRETAGQVRRAVDPPP
jgi:hypothetical protein